MSAPYSPQDFEDLIAKPGQNFCVRIINRFRFRVMVWKFMRWMLDEEGNLSTEFKQMLCDVDCDDYAPTTTTTTTSSTSSTTSTTTSTTSTTTTTTTRACDILLADNAAADPYPFEMVVSGVSDLITKVTVSLSNFSHTYPDDVDILLVAPTGEKIVLMSDCGGSNAVSGLNLVFTSDAVVSLPDSTFLTSGTFAPTNNSPSDTFSAPAPAGPYTDSLSDLIGLDPNGTWQLYVMDDMVFNGGSICDVSIDFETAPATTTTSTTSTTTSTTTTCALPGIADAPVISDCVVNSVIVTWVYSSGAEYMLLYRSVDGGAYGLIASRTTSDAESDFYTDTDTSAVSEYCYKVVMCNSCGCSEMSASACCTPSA